MIQQDAQWAGLRRMAEAWVFRREILTELEAGHPEAPYNKLASDHGQIIAHMQLGGGDAEKV